MADITTMEPDAQQEVQRRNLEQSQQAVQDSSRSDAGDQGGKPAPTNSDAGLSLRDGRSSSGGEPSSGSGSGRFEYGSPDNQHSIPGGAGLGSSADRRSTDRSQQASVDDTQQSTGGAGEPPTDSNVGEGVQRDQATSGVGTRETPSSSTGDQSSDRNNSGDGTQAPAAAQAPGIDVVREYAGGQAQPGAWHVSVDHEPGIEVSDSSEEPRIAWQQGDGKSKLVITVSNEAKVVADWRSHEQKDKFDVRVVQDDPPIETATQQASPSDHSKAGATVNASHDAASQEQAQRAAAGDQRGSDSPSAGLKDSGENNSAPQSARPGDAAGSSDQSPGKQAGAGSDAAAQQSARQDSQQQPGERSQPPAQDKSQSNSTDHSQTPPSDSDADMGLRQGAGSQSGPRIPEAGALPRVQALRIGLDHNDPLALSVAKQLADEVFQKTGSSDGRGFTYSSNSTVLTKRGFSSEEARAITDLLVEEGFEPRSQMESMDYAGRQGTDQQLARAEMEARVEALGQPTTLGGTAAAWKGALGGNAEEMRNAGQAGNTAEISALAGAGRGGLSAPPGPPVDKSADAYERPPESSIGDLRSTTFDREPATDNATLSRDFAAQSEQLQKDVNASDARPGGQPSPPPLPPSPKKPELIPPHPNSVPRVDEKDTRLASGAVVPGVPKDDTASNARSQSSGSEPGRGNNEQGGSVGSNPPSDVYDNEAWNKYYKENPNAKRSIGSAQLDDPHAFPGEETNDVTARNLSRNELLEPVVRQRFMPRASQLSNKSAGFDFAEGHRVVSTHTETKGSNVRVDQRIAGGAWTQLKILSASTPDAAVANTKTALERANNALKGVPQYALEKTDQVGPRQVYERPEEQLQYTKANAFERVAPGYSYRTSYAGRPDEVVFHLHFENVNPNDDATISRLRQAAQTSIDESPYKEDLPPIRLVITAGRLERQRQ